MHGRPWTNNEIEKATKMYKDGFSLREIGNALHRTEKAVSTYLTTHNLRPVKKPTPKRTTPRTIAKILELRTQGMNMADIGKAVGFAPGTVSRVLKKNKCQWFYPAFVWNSELTEKMENYILSDECNSVEDVARELGKTEGAVRARLASHYGYVRIKTLKEYIREMHREE